MKIHSKGPLDQAVADRIRRKRLKRIGFEASRITYDVYLRLKQALPLGATLKPLGGVVERLRMVKSDEEIARIRRSVLHQLEGFRKNDPFHSPGRLGSCASRPSSNTRCGAWARKRPPSKPSSPSASASRPAPRAAHFPEARHR